MGFFCRTIIVLLFLLLSLVSSSDVDLELKSMLAISQMALAEQSSALAQHSKALSQILQTLENNNLDSQGESQSLVQMAQGFQEHVAQLTQELSHQQSSALIQLNKELVSQHSSSLMKFTQYQCTEHSSSVSQMAEDMRLALTTSLTNQSETMIDTVSKMGESLQEAVTHLTLELGSQLSSSISQMIEMKESVGTSIRQLSESLNQTLITMSDGLQEAVIQEPLRQGERLSSSLTEQLNETFTTFENKLAQNLNQSIINLQESIDERIQAYKMSQLVLQGFKKVSDGWFRIVQEKKSWSDAREHCQRVFGAELASPPTDFDAFKAYVYDTVGGTDVWMGGLEEGSVWKYLNGLPVPSSHWNSGQPNESGEAYLVIDADTSPPIWDRIPSNAYYFACRFGWE